MNKIKVGIIGGAGYTGGELLRILVNHPNTEINFVHSRSQAGKVIYDIHTDLLGETNLIFTDTVNTSVDIVFLCVGHGEAKKFLSTNNFEPTTKIIDLSQDHRIGNDTFIYGLPELNKKQIEKANYIANPGCFATAIQLALLPLATKNILTKTIHINATTGSTGAGQSLSDTSHFSWRQNNLSVYKAFNHQHIQEIKQSLHGVQKNMGEIIFIPQRGAFARGILASIVIETEKTIAELTEIFNSFYSQSAFVFVSQKNIDLKQVVNTNKCFLYMEQQGPFICIVSIIDNLLKGAVGQAVQNMNLMFGLHETTGLKLKAIAF